METATGSCRAVVFDMDGVLIDSEPLWQEAESEAFAAVGVRLRGEDMVQTVGLRIDEVTAHWFRHSPWPGPTPTEVAGRIVDRMVERVAERGTPIPGARRAVAGARQRGAALALASSSPRRLIAAVLARFALEDAFDAVVSAEDERYGKPHPAVFLSAAAALGVPPAECLVVEDSLNGVVAAKAARMPCVAIPDPRQRDDPRFVLAEEVLGSLEELDAAVWGRWLAPPGPKDPT